MRAHLCGVRESTPAPGAAFVRDGGHTSSVAVAHDGDRSPTLLLDAGTGPRRLTELLAGEPFRGTLLLGHLHLDHTHGIPFFAAGDRDDARVSLYLPDQAAAADPPGDDAAAVLARAMSPPHFPIGRRELRGRWSFHGLPAGAHSLEGSEVPALDIPHKGGRTFAFRVSDGSGSLAYLSDHSPIRAGPGPDGLGACHPSALRLADGVDLLVHDARYTAAELEAKRRLGHSAVEYAVGLAGAAGVGRLLLFHHDPSRTDDEIDSILAACPGRPVPVSAAAEGMVVDLPARDEVANRAAHVRR